MTWAWFFFIFQVKGVYCFQVKGGPDGKEAKWIVDAKNGSGSVVYNGSGEYKQKL